MIKRVFVKSVSQRNGIEVEFLNDREWKIIINCEICRDLGVESRENLGDSIESKSDSNDSSVESQITITFFALENDIDCLVSGYLGTFLGFDSITNLKRENNHIFVDSLLNKNEIFFRLSQKDIIQSCEQISLNDKKITRDSVIMPFNGSRTTITSEILEANRGFFQNGKSGESSEFPYKARIILGAESRESNESNAESFDTNPKNAIYKAIGKAFDCATNSERIATESSLRKSEQIATSTRHSEGFSPKNPSLLDAIIFLNFRADIESLKILLLQKCTFIVCAGIPTFSVVRFAQKFGITLIAFVDYKNGDFVHTKDSQATSHDFIILTHQMRFIT